MGALLAIIPFVQVIGLAISAAGVVVPEVDRLAARHIDGGQCYAITFNRAKTAAIMRPLAVCPDQRQLALKAH